MSNRAVNLIGSNAGDDKILLVPLGKKMPPVNRRVDIWSMYRSTSLKLQFKVLILFTNFFQFRQYLGGLTTHTFILSDHKFGVSETLIC